MKNHGTSLLRKTSYRIHPFSPSAERVTTKGWKNTTTVKSCQHMTSASVNMGNANMGVFNFFRILQALLHRQSCRSTTVPMKAFHPCMAQISAEKHAEYSWLVTPHNMCIYMPPSIQMPLELQSKDAQTWEEIWKTYCIENWSWERGSKTTCLETWAGKSWTSLDRKDSQFLFADWAAPRFFAPSFGARFPVCTAFAAHPAQGLFNMELPQHFKAILLTSLCLHELPDARLASSCSRGCALLLRYYLSL